MRRAIDFVCLIVQLLNCGAHLEFWIDGRAEQTEILSFAMVMVDDCGFLLEDLQFPICGLRLGLQACHP